MKTTKQQKINKKLPMRWILNEVRFYFSRTTKNMENSRNREQKQEQTVNDKSIHENLLKLKTINEVGRTERRNNNYFASPSPFYSTG